MISKDYKLVKWVSSMKILQVYQIFNPTVASGAAKVMYDISKELVKRGHRVVVCASDMKDKYTRGKCDHKIIDGIAVHRFKTIWPLLARKFKIYMTPSLIAISGDYLRKFDVVHLHGYRSFQSVVIHHYAKKYGVPYVLQAHGSLPRIMAKQRLKWIYDVFFGYRLLRDASKVIALSQTEAQQYRVMGVPERKIEIIPNGIDLSEYADLPSKGAFKKKFNIEEDEKIILYLGRIHRIKGIDVLVKAFADVVEKLDDVRLVVVGPDDGYLGELKALVKALRMEDNVLITGPLYGEDKLEAYVDADVYVLPSRYEIWGMTVLEAYACGKPVIASNVYGLRDLVIDGVTGFLVEQGNVKQMAHSILSLIDDDGRAEEMSLKGKQFVKENFTIEEVVHRIENLYRDVVSSQSAIKAIQTIKNAQYKSSYST